MKKDRVDGCCAGGQCDGRLLSAWWRGILSSGKSKSDVGSQDGGGEVDGEVDGEGEVVSA